MNIINKFFLKLALAPSGFYRTTGVNIAQLKAILNTKLTIDDRRVSPIQQTRRKKSAKPVRFATIGTMITTAILGVIYLFAFYFGANPVTHLTIYFSFFFFMLSATLISDFTTVLIDAKDTFIILPKPVNDRTFLVARLLHIFIHLCKLVLPMSLGGLVYVGVHCGIGASAALLFIVMLVTMFSIFFINALYIIILRLTTPQKFQSIISYIQIIFAVIMYASYQIIPRMVNKLGLQNFDINTVAAVKFYPIYWFAQCWQVLSRPGGNMMEISFAVMAVLLPVCSIYIVVRYLAPSFNNKLAMINATGGQETAPVQMKKVERNRTSYSTLLSRIFTKTNAEKMGFQFAWKLSSRSRDFKMKVYPSIGYLMVYVVIMFINNKHLTLYEIRHEEGSGKVVIISALYFTSILLTMALNQIIYSDKYKASWIYYVAPLQKPGDVILGGAKAAIFKFYIPIVCFITLAGLVLIGPWVLPNVILGLFNELLIATSMVFIGNKMFPFSVQQNNNVKGGSFLRSMAILMFSALLATGHYFIYDMKPVVIISAILSVIATWLLMGSIRNITWASVRSSYED